MVNQTAINMNNKQLNVIAEGGGLNDSLSFEMSSPNDSSTNQCHLTHETNKHHVFLYILKIYQI